MAYASSCTGFASTLLVATICLAACGKAPCTNRSPVVEGGKWEQVGARGRATVLSSQDASALGRPITYGQLYQNEFDFTFTTDYRGGFGVETQLFGFAPVVPQCGHFNASFRLPLDGRWFVMTCSPSWVEVPDAELRLQYIVDEPVVEIDGIGPEGRFVGEYRNGTEVYSVEIYGLYGEFDACDYGDNYE